MMNVGFYSNLSNSSEGNSVDQPTVPTHANYTHTGRYFHELQVLKLVAAVSLDML